MSKDPQACPATWTADATALGVDTAETAGVWDRFVGGAGGGIEHFAAAAAGAFCVAAGGVCCVVGDALGAVGDALGGGGDVWGAVGDALGGGGDVWGAVGDASGAVAVGDAFAGVGGACGGVGDAIASCDGCDVTTGANDFSGLPTSAFTGCANAGVSALVPSSKSVFDPLLSESVGVTAGCTSCATSAGGAALGNCSPAALGNCSPAALGNCCGAAGVSAAALGGGGGTRLRFNTLATPEVLAAVWTAGDFDFLSTWSLPPGGDATPGGTSTNLRLTGFCFGGCCGGDIKSSRVVSREKVAGEVGLNMVLNT